MNGKTQFNETRPLYRLMELASILRKSCPWDREQTSLSLRPYLIEEAYEVYDAIESEDASHMKEELGDLLYQVYAHSEIANEENKFNIDDVAQGILNKLINRHPHVFGDKSVKDSKEVIESWEKIKRKEKISRESILDGVPRHLPSLLKAYRVQQKVSRFGFDWENVDGAVKKLDEEIGEFKEAIAANDHSRITEETGDILFSLVNISRFMHVNPEEALSKTIDKVIKRFRFIEKEAADSGKDLGKMTLPEMDELWEKAKREED